LTGAAQIEISEHLSGCPECRREEAAYQAVRNGVPNLTTKRVSTDFNTQLLNRVAQERFAETRSAAYFPRTSVRTFNRGWVPVFATAVVAFATIGLSISSRITAISPMSVSSSLDNSYLTVQPANNPNLTAQLPKNWSLNGHLEKSDRYNRLSTSVAPTWTSFTSSTMAHTRQIDRYTPYNTMTFQGRPIVRQYIQPSGAILTSGGATTY
jgi:hypothetical protein